MNEKQEYHSPLRQEQMKRTREQILEGLIKTFAGGITSLSIPEVARNAGVSVPTVYRYFRTKRELVEALQGYLLEKSGLGQGMSGPPQSPEELITTIRRMYASLEGQDEAMRAAAVSELANELRREAKPMRLKLMETALAPVRDQFNDTDWQHLCTIVLLLSSSALARAFHDYLGLSGEKAADTVAWTIRTLTQAHSQEEGTEPS